MRYVTEYTVSVSQEQDAQLDALLIHYLQFNPAATVDDALNSIFTAGMNVLKTNYQVKT